MSESLSKQKCDVMDLAGGGGGGGAKDGGRGEGWSKYYKVQNFVEFSQESFSSLMAENCPPLHVCRWQGRGNIATWWSH